MARIKIKICRRCGGEGPFGKNLACKDGLDIYCKKCCIEKIKAYLETEHGKKVQREYQNSEHGKKARRKAGEKYQKSKRGKEARIKVREKYPEKIRARHCISYAIASGKITRPSVCSIDDEDCKGRIEAHHEDYSKPYEVIWLCRFHHRPRHQELRVTE